jgi:hypothetical protein
MKMPKNDSDIYTLRTREEKLWTETHEIKRQQSKKRRKEVYEDLLNTCCTNGGQRNEMKRTKKKGCGMRNAILSASQDIGEPAFDCIAMVCCVVEGFPR